MQVWVTGILYYERHCVETQGFSKTDGGYPKDARVTNRPGKREPWEFPPL